MPVHIHTEAFCCFHTVQQYNWGVYPPIFAYIFAGVHLVRVDQKGYFTHIQSYICSNTIVIVDAQHIGVIGIYGTAPIICICRVCHCSVCC